ncbi:MAG: STM4015 family protein [Azonexus sp.]
MTIGDHQSSFFGKPIVDYQKGEPVEALDKQVYRLSLDYDDETPMAQLLDEFLNSADKAQLDALVIGMWEEAYENSAQEALDLLVTRKDELPALKALFIGDITYEECEISWIHQASYSKLLAAFPNLEALSIRGSTELSIEAFSHARLRELRIECGGLPAEILRNLAASSLPALQRLELWLGTEEYGFDGSLDDVIACLAAIKPERLDYLGLRDAQIADEVAIWLAGQAWLGQIPNIDLSLGTLGDAGAEALCNSPYLQGVKHLDLSHHYISESWQKKLASLPLTVVLDDPQEEEDEDDRYVAVGE